MEYTPDIVSEWPAFADEPFTGAAALFVADRDMDGDAFRVIADGAAKGRYFALFSSSESDTALHRKLTFRTRYPDVAAFDETAERSWVIDGTIWRVALLGLTSPALVRDALQNDEFPTRAVRARRVLIRIENGVDVDALASALVIELARRNGSLGNWQVRWLLRAGLDFGILVVQPEDSLEGHWPGLGFYGPARQVGQIWKALAADHRT